MADSNNKAEIDETEPILWVGTPGQIDTLERLGVGCVLVTLVFSALLESPPLILLWLSMLLMCYSRGKHRKADRLATAVEMPARAVGIAVLFGLVSSLVASLCFNTGFALAGLIGPTVALDLYFGWEAILLESSMNRRHAKV